MWSLWGRLIKLATQEEDTENKWHSRMGHNIGHPHYKF